MVLWLLEIPVLGPKGRGGHLRKQMVNSSQNEAFQENKGLTTAMEAQDYKEGPRGGSCLLGSIATSYSSLTRPPTPTLPDIFRIMNAILANT